MMKRPEKHLALLQLIRGALRHRQYTLADHVLRRLAEREIGLVELLHVLETGWHEKAKDKFDALHKAWNYSIRGKTGEGRSLRVAVSLAKGLLIITVIDLDA